MMEREANYATAIKRGKKSNFWELLNCLSWATPQSKISVVKLTILENHKKLKDNHRICRVRVLSGAAE